MLMTVVPLVMSGGSGTRLWPLSRRSRPKQFLAFDDGLSLFGKTIQRCSGDVFDPRPIVVASKDHRFLVAEDLRAINRDADILLEPAPRNSCPAILAGCLQAVSRDRNAIVLVLAADHLIEDRKAFERSITDAIPAVHDGGLVTFGVTPTRPATGYGYICPGKGGENNTVLPVDRFIEKPDAATAERYVRDGYLWNSGNFLFKAQAFLDEAARLVPEMHQQVTDAFTSRSFDLDFIRLGAEAFDAIEPISVDYAIMEKTTNAFVCPVEHDWSDIGTWNSVWQSLPKDDQDNAVVGNAEVENSRGNLVHSDGQLTVLLGVDDLVVVVTRDAVLATTREQSERIGDLVKLLEQQGRKEAAEALRVYRPWGNYEALDNGTKYQVKRIVILPGGTL